MSEGADQEANLNALLVVHAWRFKNVKRIHFANGVRNDVVHGDGAYGPADWEKADKLFDEALVSIANTLSPEDRDEILGIAAGDGPRTPMAAGSYQVGPPVEIKIGRQFLDFWVGQNSTRYYLFLVNLITVNRPLSPPKIEFPSGVALMASILVWSGPSSCQVERGLIFGIKPVTFAVLGAADVYAIVETVAAFGGLRVAYIQNIIFVYRKSAWFAK